jgi:hypothetical protein
MNIDTTGDLDWAVVGVDGTWNALGALTWAATEARLRGVALHILHAAAGATTGTTRVQDVRDRAFATARLAQPDLPVTIAHADNTPVAALLLLRSTPACWWSAWPIGTGPRSWGAAGGATRGGRFRERPPRRRGGESRDLPAYRRGSSR